jgi:hypothetical protein
MKLHRFFQWLIVSLLVTLGTTACGDFEQDLQNAPNDHQINRYGLDILQLGSKSSTLLPQLEARLKHRFTCNHHSVALNQIKRKFTVQDCNLNIDDKPAKWWGETIESLQLQFVEQQLVKIELTLSINQQYEKLYSKHAKRLFGQLGKPDQISLEKVVWEDKGDRAILREIEKGKLHLLVQNKQLSDKLIRTQNLFREK